MNAQRDPLNLIICGIGGQGNILLSRMIGRILASKGYEVNIGETFGAAQRGGAVSSNMRISKEKKCGPVVPEGCGHVILGLEPLEALRVLCFFGNPAVVTVTNTQPIYPVGVLAKRLTYPNLDEVKATIQELSSASWFLDATVMALELHSPIVVNILMLGALIGSGTIPISMEDAERELRSNVSAAMIDLNLEALQKGFEAIG